MKIDFDLASKCSFGCADELLMHFFNLKRYPSKFEKEKMAEMCNVDLQYVTNFFYSIRSQVKKIEGKDKKQNLYKFKNNSMEIKPIEKDGQGSQKQSSCHLFCYGNNNSLYKKLPFKPN